MAKTYGKEFPERPLMSVLSDLLGIPHFTIARGSTVRRDFLDAVATALGATPTDLAARTKDQTLALCIELATRSPMDPALYSTGTTVTNRALQTIIDGVLRNGAPGRDLPDAGMEPLVDETDPLPELFDPVEMRDERDRRLAMIAARQGQNRFRSAVMEAYGFRCAVTGYDAVDALQAAHIFPYRGPQTNRVSNGLLLRADIHALFDRGGLAIHESTYEVLLKQHLHATTYAELHGQSVRLPAALADRPFVTALRNHREWAGL